jgi:hypothetical protein
MDDPPRVDRRESEVSPMVRNRASARRLAAVAAAGALAGLAALAAADPASAAVRPTTLTSGVLASTTLASSALASSASLASAALAAGVGHSAHGTHGAHNAHGAHGAAPAPPAGLRAQGVDPAPEPPMLPEPCPYLAHRHEPENLITRLLQNVF